MRIAFLRLEDQKGGFREDQPRWPKGSGESSGRWSGGAGVAAPTGVSKPRVDGHHIVSRGVFGSREFNLSAEARAVFDAETTGPLYGASHVFDKMHRQYNLGVADALRNYLRQRGIQGWSMTAADAEEFLRKVYNSQDPRIREYNLYIYRQRLLQIIRRFGPIGRE